jgi:hypothetical protein
MSHKSFNALALAIQEGKNVDNSNRKNLALYLSTKQPEFLAWLSDFARIDGNAQAVKDIQSCFNKAPTQKLFYKLEPRDSLTTKARVKRGNKKLLEQGLCTQADIDSKAYMMFESEIVVTETTALDKMQKLITEFGLTKAQAGKVLEKCDF